jgi:predicted branched-subunit amino acid permease
MSPSFKAGARAGFRACLPVSVGLVPWALVTGLAMVGAGFSTVQAMGMSLIVFGATAQLGTLPLIVAGAPLWLIVATAQLGTLPLIVAGAPLWLIVATALVVNLRFLIFSAAMARPLAGGRSGLRWLCGYLLTDGVFATMLERLRTEPDPAWRLGAYLAPSLWCALVWQTSTLVGVLAAGSIPRNWSLEFMASIALLVLMVPMARVRPMLVSAATGGVLAVVLRGMPLKLGVMVAIVGGIAAGFAAEHWQGREARR